MNTLILSLFFIILIIVCIYKRKMNTYIRVSKDIDIFEMTKDFTWDETSNYIDKISNNNKERQDLKSKISQLRELKNIE